MVGSGDILLIVDDEPDVLDTLQEFASAVLPGVTVETATSGLDALDAMGRHAPQAILCDYRMPGLDGVEVLRRSQHVAPAARRALMTAFADSSLQVRASRIVPLDGFIEKALDPAVLGTKLRELMGIPA